MTCFGRNRQGKIARGIADKGICSTKNMYYHGLKLHCVRYRRKGHLHFPCQFVLSPISEKDLTVFKRDCAPELVGKQVYADKTYQDRLFWQLEEKKGNTPFSPVKAIKGACITEKQWDKAADDLYFAAASSVLEPIEALFG